MIVTLLILLAVLFAAGAFVLVRWLQPEITRYSDDDEDEDTVWADAQEWGLLQRIFGRKPLRLPRPTIKDDAKPS